MIIDTFIFFNELELLDIRLNILNDCVDRFVLVEATRTFQGKPKPLYFEENKSKFSKFKHKITHVIVDDLPVNVAPFDREYFQRDAILRGLSGCSAEDLIILSDLDEIPNPEVIPKYLEKGLIGLFIQKFFYYTLHSKCVELESLPWSLIVNFDEIGLPAVLRKRVVAYHSAILSKAEPDPHFKFKTIENGGWHFSYLGGPEAIRKKIEAYSHDELNIDEFKNIHNIQTAIADGRDIFGRKLSFADAAIEELPKFIVENFSAYKNKGLIDFSFDKNSYQKYLYRQRDAAIAERDAAIAERDAAFAERDAAVAERDSAVALASLMKRSRPWRLTAPLRFAARLLRYGLTNQDRQRITQSLRHRYHRLPLPAPVKKMASFVYHKALGKFIKALRRLAFSAFRFNAPSIKPAPNVDSLLDYIVWGVIDWHFRHQRPQQLALVLAATGRRVFYISSVLVDDERAGFEAEALDASGQLFQIKLFAKGAPSIYSDAPSLEIVGQLRRSIGEVLDWAGCTQIVSMAQHSFWCDVAAVLPNSQLVYDCMDHHEGFDNADATLVQLEKTLFCKSDLTVTTSAWLDRSVAEQTRHRVLIRNAAEYTHFSRAPESVYRDPRGRRIIGYYGAIAEWLDLDLVEAVAKRYPECCVLLIGADSVNAKSRLGKLPNVTFIGEVPYNKLPYYLYSFDICLLPFKVVPLTMATNPVKVYEYLSAGKPIVSVDLPEMTQFDGLVYVVADQTQYLTAVDAVLAQVEPEDLIQRRKDFAQGQTWNHRAEALIQHAESKSSEPKVSVIVVTYNNLEFTRACLTSLDEHTNYENLEIIVVDNASADGSPAFLENWVSVGPNRKLILNQDNRGFAAANNQGLSIAAGEFLVMLNNDTYVTPGWVRTLIRHLKHDKSIGLIGPVTNNIGNEAKIDIRYADMSEMLVKSAAYTRRHMGQTYPLRTAAFFCVMMPRTSFEAVGALDEAFGRGFFEDDDYCRRIEQQGMRVVCAEDVFIHHHLSASFNKLKQQDRQQLFEDNKKIYEAKWGEWVPHGYRGMKPGQAA